MDALRASLGKKPAAAKIAAVAPSEAPAVEVKERKGAKRAGAAEANKPAGEPAAEPAAEAAPARARARK